MSTKSWVVVLALISTGCIGGDHVRGTVQRPIGAFSKISVDSGIVATVEIGPTDQVVLSGDENLLGLFSAEVDGDTLVASVGTASPTMPFTLSVKTPSLDGITATAGSSVTTPDLSALQLARMDLLAGGGSSVKLGQLSATDTGVLAEGGSTVEITGHGTNLSVNLSGASELTAPTYQVDTASVSASGASSAEVMTTSSITGSLSGSSRLTVFGNPPNRNVSTEDSSSVAFR